MNQHLERLDGLAPIMRRPVQLLLDRCEAKLAKRLLIVSGWRSVQEQMLNYQKGRTINRETGDWEVSEPRLVVTNAKPGLTPHNVVTAAGTPASLAVDVVPLTAAGAADWTIDRAFWDALYTIAWSVGLDPLGDRVGAYLAGDLGHFQEPGWAYKLDGLGYYVPTIGAATSL